MVRADSKRVLLHAPAFLDSYKAAQLPPVFFKPALAEIIYTHREVMGFIATVRKASEGPCTPDQAGLV